MFDNFKELLVYCLFASFGYVLGIYQERANRNE